MSPLYAEVGTCWFTSVRSVFLLRSVSLVCPINFCPALNIVQVGKHKTLTQCRANVGAPSHAEPSLAQYCYSHAECGPASQTAGRHYPSFGAR